MTDDTIESLQARVATLEAVMSEQATEAAGMYARQYDKLLAAEARVAALEAERDRLQRRHDEAVKERNLWQARWTGMEQNFRCPGCGWVDPRTYQDPADPWGGIEYEPGPLRAPHLDNVGLRIVL